MTKVNLHGSNIKNTSTSSSSRIRAAAFLSLQNLYSPIRLSRLSSVDNLSGAKILKCNFRGVMGATRYKLCTSGALSFSPAFFIRFDRLRPKILIRFFRPGCGSWYFWPGCDQKPYSVLSTVVRLFPCLGTFDQWCDQWPGGGGLMNIFFFSKKQ